jgi:hypothetical protein
MEMIASNPKQANQKQPCTTVAGFGKNKIKWWKPCRCTTGNHALNEHPSSIEKCRISQPLSAVAVAQAIQGSL